MEDIILMQEAPVLIDSLLLDAILSRSNNLIGVKFEYFFSSIALNNPLTNQYPSIKYFRSNEGIKVKSNLLQSLPCFINAESISIVDYESYYVPRLTRLEQIIRELKNLKYFRLEIRRCFFKITEPNFLIIRQKIINNEPLMLNQFVLVGYTK
jgi:hypothetical protein